MDSATGKKEAAAATTETLFGRTEIDLEIASHLREISSALVRYDKDIEELDCIESATIEPLRVAAMRRSGIAVETTLRDRQIQALELLQWTDAVASQQADNDDGPSHVAATDDQVVLDPGHIVTSLRNAIDLLEQYGTKQMMLARSMEQREIGAVDVGKSISANTRDVVCAVSRELERCSRLSKAKHRRELTEEADTVRRPPPAQREKNKPPTVSANVIDAKLVDELKATKAALRSTEALCRDVEHLCARRDSQIAALEEELRLLKDSAAATQSRLTALQQDRLHMSRGSTATQTYACTSGDLRCDRSINTEPVKGLPPLILLGQGSIRRVKSGSMNMLLSMDADSETGTLGSSVRLPFASFDFKDATISSHRAQLGEWTTGDIVRLLRSLTSSSRRHRVELLAYRFCLRAALRASARESTARSPLSSTSAALVAAAREAQRQAELKLKYREGELAKSVEQRFALASEVARLKGLLENKAAGTTITPSVIHRSSVTSNDDILHLPSRCLDVVSLCIASWQATRRDIAARIERLSTAKFSSESAARREVCLGDVQLIRDMDAYFLGASSRLESIAHPAAASLVALLGEVADRREADAASFSAALRRIDDRSLAVDNQMSQRLVSPQGNEAAFGGGAILAVSLSLVSPADSAPRRAPDETRRVPSQPITPQSSRRGAQLRRSRSAVVVPPPLPLETLQDSMEPSDAQPVLALGGGSRTSTPSRRMRSNPRSESSSSEDDASFLTTWRTVDEPVTIEYRQQPGQGDVVKVCSRAVQCTPVVISEAHSRLKKMRKRLHRVTGVDDGPPSGRRQTTGCSTAADASVAASTRRTRRLAAERFYEHDAAMLREQVHSIYRSVVSRAKARSVRRVAKKLKGLLSRGPLPRSVIEHLQAMFIRHKRDAEALEQRRINLLLERTANLQQFFKLHPAPAEEARPPLIITRIGGTSVRPPSEVHQQASGAGPTQRSVDVKQITEGRRSVGAANARSIRGDGLLIGDPSIPPRRGVTHAIDQRPRSAVASKRRTYASIVADHDVKTTAGVPLSSRCFVSSSGAFAETPEPPAHGWQSTSQAGRSLMFHVPPHRFLQQGV